MLHFIYTLSTTFRVMTEDLHSVIIIYLCKIWYHSYYGMFYTDGLNHNPFLLMCPEVVFCLFVFCSLGMLGLLNIQSIVNCR